MSESTGKGTREQQGEGVSVLEMLNNVQKLVTE